MNKSTRKLKVVKSFSTNPKAHLPLSGWLEQAGFSIGTEVNVIVRDKRSTSYPAVG